MILLSCTPRENPHGIVAQTSEDRRECKKRLNEYGIPVFTAVDTRRDNQMENLPGFPEGTTYAMIPQNRYQQWLRQGMEGSNELTAHYTRKWMSHIVEALVLLSLLSGTNSDSRQSSRTATVPLKPLANHMGKCSVLWIRRAPDKLYERIQT